MPAFLPSPNCVADFWLPTEAPTLPPTALFGVPVQQVKPYIGYLPNPSSIELWRPFIYRGFALGSELAEAFPDPWVYAYSPVTPWLRFPEFRPNHVFRVTSLAHYFDGGEVLYSYFTYLTGFVV